MRQRSLRNAEPETGVVGAPPRPNGLALRRIRGGLPYGGAPPDRVVLVLVAPSGTRMSFLRLCLSSATHSSSSYSVIISTVIAPIEMMKNLPYTVHFFDLFSAWEEGGGEGGRGVSGAVLNAGGMIWFYQRLHNVLVAYAFQILL